jgi:hypothetical protein
MTRIMITLPQNEREALRELAQREHRDPRAQAALIIRDGLERAGLLPTATPTSATTLPRISGTTHDAE